MLLAEADEAVAEGHVPKDMRPFYDDVIVPKLADAGLIAEESSISPVWVFAKP